MTNVPPNPGNMPPNPSFRERAAELATAFGRGAQQRGEQLINGVVRGSQLAYWGLVENVSRIRSQMAGATMERMEHKQGLTRELGRDALRSLGINTPPNLAGEAGYRPRTALERTMAVRIDRQAQQTAESRAHRKYVVGAYKGETESRMSGNIGMISNPDNTGRLASIGLETSRARRQVEREFRAGTINAQQRAERIEHLQSPTISVEAYDQRRSRQRLGAEEENVREVADPNWTRVRDWRRDRAVGRIETNHHRAERARTRREALGSTSNPRYRRNLGVLDRHTRDVTAQDAYVAPQPTPLPRPRNQGYSGIM
ncbi:MAG: hypothetical protein M3P98_00080 [bacterium]|nr:hypothetical protein [bacterium]